MKDWAELADEYRDLELRHKEYREVSNEGNNEKNNNNKGNATTTKKMKCSVILSCNTGNTCW